MKLLDVVGEVRRHLEENGRVSLRMLRRQYELDDEALDELIEELVDVQRVARREENVLVWSAQVTPPTSVDASGTARPADQPAARGPDTRGADARKVVTILFADLAGSTGLHERLDPESVNAFMERYYQAMRGAVEAHRGTVVKFLGDGVMAAFGVPRVAEDDAMRAVRAAVAMQEAFRQLAGEQSARVGEIGLRVALNTGEVVVNADNTDVVGDPVNVAARLQQEAHNGDVVLGESTHRLVAALVTLAPLGSVTLKGRAEAVKAYRVESLERPVGTATAAFVGRDDELGRITAVYDAAIATTAARLVVLLGSPGLGKSRMIEEFARRLDDAATVLTAQCDAAGGATFAPLAEALRELLSAHRDQVPLLTKEGSGEVGQLAKQPPPSPLLGKEGDESTSLRTALEVAVPAADADRTRIIAGITALLAGSPASPEETFFVIRRFLAALAQTKPVVLVIDDLQWAEPLLLDLVEHLVQWGSGVPLLVLVGARPELRDLRSSLVTPGGLVADVLTLAGLDAGAAMRLAANVIGAADLPAAVAAKVLATSEGNPLFVGELVRMLVQEGALTKEGDRWIPGVALAALEMPPTIHALLAARIERLRPEERSVLERAAVVGRHFSRSAVAELLPRDVVDLDARLEALRRSELIQRDTGWFLGEPVLRFHHILIRDAAYRRLLKGTRAELHARFADWITARADAADHDEAIGWHLEQAHQLLRELGPLDQAGRALGERAARHLAVAGRRALARDDLPVAANLLGRAVDRLDVDDAARADLALDWCEALLAAGDVGPAVKAIHELGRFIGDSSAEQMLAPSPTHPLSVGEGGGEGTSGGDTLVARASGTLTPPR
jgi:class 3 adenylate cyclase